MSNYRDKINLDDLFERKKKLSTLRTDIYKKILNRVHTKIKHTSRQRNSEHFCFYIVPEFVVGTPMYDSAACIAYIMDKLIENNFVIKYTHPNLLFISWKHYIPKYERVEFKKKYGYAIDGFGNHIKYSKNNNKNNENGDVNALLLKKKDIAVNSKKKDAKNYTNISKYKPTGNFIYNNELLRKIEDSTNK
tara:strand:+ start:339 stop:911 length:573 start_codon:yes stop_codon:yes gene_type:complete